MTSDDHAASREQLRQRLLLQALWQRGPALQGWLRDSPERAAQGLAAYRGNGRALAERALAAAFPTVVELLGSESFAALARAFWQRHPPTDGDIATHGEALSGFIKADAQLATEPYLADVARLDWAVHRGAVAAEADAVDPGLHHLADDDAAACRLRLRPGTAVLASRWPVVTLWQAHQSTAADRFEPLREAMARGDGQCALVHRDGWRVRVQTLADEPTASFTAAALAGQTLGMALECAGNAFRFEPWLVQALQQRWLLAVVPATQPTPGDHA